MAWEKLPAAPDKYDREDQDRMRRIVERALKQPPAPGTIEVTQVVKEIVTVARRQVQKTTGSLATGGIENGSIDLGVPSDELIGFLVDQPCWVRFYATVNDRNNDSGRIRTVDPTPGTGVLGEFIILSTQTGVTFHVAPMIYLYNNDNPVSTLLYYAITNDAASTTPINVTLTMVDVETKP